MTIKEREALDVIEARVRVLVDILGTCIAGQRFQRDDPKLYAEVRDHREAIDRAIDTLRRRVG